MKSNISLLRLCVFKCPPTILLLSDYTQWTLKFICIKTDLMSRLWIAYKSAGSSFNCAAKRRRHGGLGAILLQLCIKCGGQLQCFQPNCCYKRAVPAAKCANLLTNLLVRLSSRDEDDVSVKLSIKYSSAGSQMSFFFPWAIGQEGRRGVSSAAREPMKSLACAHMSFSGQFLMTDIDVW